VAEKHKESQPVPRGSFVPTERFSFDMLEEVPRQHVIDVLELYAKAMALPPKWAVERWSQNLERWSQDQQPTRGRPKRSTLVDRIRFLAVSKCASRGADKYKRAAKLLKSVPAALFCGLSIAASPSVLKKSYLAFPVRYRSGPQAREWAELRHYLPLLHEALDKADQKIPH
jgi:hypothetical protein